MPSKSEKQRRYLYARFGKAWVEAHHFDVVQHESPHKAHKRSKKKR